MFRAVLILKLFHNKRSAFEAEVEPLAFCSRKKATEQIGVEVDFTPAKAELSDFIINAIRA